MQSDDAQIVKQVLDGNNEDFETLVKRHATMVRAVIYSMVGNNSSAEDLAQETFLRSFKYLNTLSEPGNYGGWLCGITRRVCLDFLRSNRRPILSLNDLTGDAGEPSQPEDREAGLKDDVQEAVLNLPEDLRQVMLMRYINGLPYERIAKILGVSRATVSFRLVQARRLLRAKFGK